MICSFEAISGWHSYCLKGGMSYLDLKIPHGISRQEALARIKQTVADLKQQHQDILQGIDEYWDGPEGRLRFSAKGMSLFARIYVGVDSIQLGSRLPLALAFYKNKIADKIQEKAIQLLS